MKYIVDVNGERVTVDLTADGATVDGTAVDARVSEVGGTPVQVVTIGSEVHRVVVRRQQSRGCYTLWLDGFRFEVEALDERTRTIRDLSAAAEVDLGPKPLVAPMPGLVVRVLVAAGDTVQAGQGMVVMEAMKMENELRASSPGTVRRVVVPAGSPVEKGALLIELE